MDNKDYNKILENFNLFKSIKFQKEIIVSDFDIDFDKVSDEEIKDFFNCKSWENIKSKEIHQYISRGSTDSYLKRVEFVEKMIMNRVMKKFMGILK